MLRTRGDGPMTHYYIVPDDCPRYGLDSPVTHLEEFLTAPYREVWSELAEPSYLDAETPRLTESQFALYRRKYDKWLERRRRRSEALARRQPPPPPPWWKRAVQSLRNRFASTKK